MFKSKYKKNLQALLDEKEFNQVAFNKLHHSVELTPVKLPKVFKILDEYIDKNLSGNEITEKNETFVQHKKFSNTKEYHKGNKNNG